MTTEFFHSTLMLRFGKIKVAKKKNYGAKNNKIWDVNVDNIVI